MDFRARVHSAEEAEFLAAKVAGHGRDLDGSGITYTSLENAPAVLLAGLEAEEEAPGVFLRLRKAHRKHAQRTWAVATHATRGLTKAGGTLLPAAPGTEPEWLDALASGVGLDALGQQASEALRAKGAVILVGERLAGVPGALTAAVRCATATGARLAWIPRRAGERGAVEAGAMPGLLPGGRPLTDPRARDEVADVWGVATLPSGFGRDTGQMIQAVDERRAGRAGGRRCRTGRPARPGPRPRGAGRGRLPGQPGAAAHRGHRARRRGAAGGRGRREGRHLPGLGGPRPPVRGRAQARPADHPPPPDGRAGC